MNMPIRATSDAFHEAWRLRWPFLLSHLVFTLLVAAALAPLTALALRATVALSGQPALSDMDIAFFLLSPAGFAAALLVASLILTTAVLDTAFMMAIALDARRSRRVRFEAGLLRILPGLVRVVGFALRLLLRVIGIAAPFLLVALAVAAWLLRDYDINYYLSERPPEFQLAAGLIGGVVVALLAVLMRALTGWALALPLVLFEHVSPRDSFGRSTALMRGQRWDLFLSLLVWAAGSALALTLALGAVRLLAGGVAAAIGPDLGQLALALGLLVGLWSFVNLLVTTLTTGALACLLMDRAGWPGTAGALREAEGDRRRLRGALVLGVAVSLVLLALGSLDLATRKVPDNVEIIGHRGAAGQRPENTMASFAKAIEDGADWIELDVQESAEGEVIVIHDSDFMKLAGIDLKAWDATADRLAEIDIGSWYGADFADERTPTLRQVLELARGTDSGVLIELKYYGHDEMLEQRVADVVAETGMDDQVQAMSLKYEGVQKMKALRPDWQVGLLAATSVGRLWELDADFLAVNAGSASHRLVRAAREAGKRVHVWTVNDPLAMSEMLSLGVDGLITDEPALARSVVAERAELGTLERLVLAMASRLGLRSSDKAYRDGSP